MSITNVIPYFRSILKGLGHKEWEDAFNNDNIPSTILNNAFHLRLGDGTPIKQNMHLIEMEQPIKVSLFLKGYLKPALGRDNAVKACEAVMKKALNAETRTSEFVGIKNVLFSGFRVGELAIENDNVIRAEIDFNCVVYLETT